MFLWSTGFIGAKFGLPYAEPLTFLLVRYLLVMGLMLPVALAMKAPWPRDVRQWFHIGVSGILVHATYLGGVFSSIAHGLPAGVSSLVVGIQPLLTAVGAGWLLGERVVPRQWLGLVLGFVGVALVLSNKLAGVAAWGPQVWPALIALAGITAGTLYQKRFCPSFDLRTGAIAQFLPSAVVTLLVASQVESFRIDWTPQFGFAMAWLVLAIGVGWLIQRVALEIGKRQLVDELDTGSERGAAQRFYDTLLGDLRTFELWALIAAVVAAAGIYLFDRFYMQKKVKEIDAAA